MENQHKPLPVSLDEYKRVLFTQLLEANEACERARKATEDLVVELGGYGGTYYSDPRYAAQSREYINKVAFAKEIQATYIDITSGKYKDDTIDEITQRMRQLYLELTPDDLVAELRSLSLGPDSGRASPMHGVEVSK
ncbi:hypothetical protein BJ508DRAFT_333455 [Ascobolus immersus RN42]|uniref:Uncharacterized protein n=1 Tax=Ascobolus immersus RN42 TaxID=1160509 RepID=A0A3N4HJL9_ASCIM|nr:hypothetical protein BJ508DRAFT_333455 [Ascobolus immersus RN42]